MWTDVIEWGHTDGQTPDRYITLSARRGQRDDTTNIMQYNIT